MSARSLTTRKAKQRSARREDVCCFDTAATAPWTRCSTALCDFDCKNNEADEGRDPGVLEIELDDAVAHESDDKGCERDDDDRGGDGQLRQRAIVRNGSQS